MTIERGHPVLSMLLSVALLVATGTAAAAASGGGQGYPTKPLRLVVPFPAGASSDIVGRIIGDKLSTQIGEQVLADNADAVGRYKAGNANVFGALVGMVMKKSGGRANAKLVKELLEQKLA